MLISVRIVDEDGRRVRRGTAGHIWIASRSRIISYLGDEDAYARNLHGRWWDTNDMGKVDRFGRLHLLDREVDQLEGLSSGLWYEDLLMERSPAIREAVVIQKDGEPVFLISTNAGRKLGLAEVRDMFADIPEIARVYIVDHDVFPFTATRKVQRPDLTWRASDAAIFPRFILDTIDLKAW